MQSSTRQKVDELLGPKYHTDTMRALGLDPEQLAHAHTLQACLALYEQAPEGSDMRQQIFEKALRAATSLPDKVKLALWTGTRSVYCPLTAAQKEQATLRAIESASTICELEWIGRQIVISNGGPAIKRAYMERELELHAPCRDANLWDMRRRASQYELPGLVEKLNGLMDERNLARLRCARTIEACVEAYNYCDQDSRAHIKAHDKLAGMIGRRLMKQPVIAELKKLHEHLENIRLNHRPRRRIALKRRQEEVRARLKELLKEQLRSADTPSECREAYSAAPWNWQWFRHEAAEKHEQLLAQLIATAENEGQLLVVIEEAWSLSFGITHPVRLEAIQKLAQLLEDQTA